MKRFLKNNRGQSSVEYALMILVVVTMIYSVFGKLNDYLIGSGSCPGDSFLCRFVDVYGGPGYFSGNYKYFTLKR